MRPQVVASTHQLLSFTKLFDTVNIRAHLHSSEKVEIKLKMRAVRAVMLARLWHLQGPGGDHHALLSLEDSLALCAHQVAVSGVSSSRCGVLQARRHRCLREVMGLACSISVYLF